MNSKIILLLITLFSFVFMNCGGNSSETANDVTENQENASGNSADAPKTIADAMKEAEKTMNELQGGEAKPVINFRELKEMLPEKLAGMKRESSTGETTGMMGMNVSHAEGKYTNDDKSARMRINITDVGGFGPAMMGMASWASLEFDKETDNGYEKTTTVDGYKAYEKYNSKSKDGEVAVLVAQRFIVNANGTNVSVDDLKSALKDLDLDDLAAKK